MNKMERPMMTVVRFGAEDVIATSTQAYGVLGERFVALGSEINQFEKLTDNVSGPYTNSDNLYVVEIDPLGEGVQVQGEEYTSESSYAYAWYSTTNGYGWTTEGRTPEAYGNVPGDLPRN